MLIAVTVMPIIFGLLTDVPEGTPPAAAPVAAGATLAALVVLALRAPAAWRLVGAAHRHRGGLRGGRPLRAVRHEFRNRSPLDRSSGQRLAGIGPDARCGVLGVAAGVRGRDPGRRDRDHWRRRCHSTGLAAPAPGNRFSPGAGRSQRRRGGNLLSGLVGTPPNTTYSTSISLAELTGVAARRVGVYIGIVFVVLAFSPKVTALLIAIPNPVAAAYVTLLIGLLFAQGMKLVVEDGLDHRKAAVVGLSFWIGVGFQNQAVFADLLAGRGERCSATA